MKRAAIVLHDDRPEAAEIGRWLAEVLTQRGVDVRALTVDVPRMKDLVAPADEEEFSRGFDLMFALGGDGTFLRAAELAYKSATPLLGVNLGRLGFLAAVEQTGVEAAIDRILEKGFDVTERMTMDIEIIFEDRPVQKLWALNDVSLSKLAPGRLIKLGISIAGEAFMEIAADGVVVATPTGSTAYSFSAGGPIVSPEIDCLIVTPVSPHLTFDRSVVAGANEQVDIWVRDDPDAVAASADGRPWVDVPPGSVVRINRSPRRLRLASIEPAPFWRLVRSKFRLPYGWTDPSAQPLPPEQG